MPKKRKLDKLGRDCTNWGGPRKNSGRPSLGRVFWAVRVKPGTARAIVAAAKSAGQTTGEFLEARFPSHVNDNA